MALTLHPRVPSLAQAQFTLRAGRPSKSAIVLICEACDFQQGLKMPDNNKTFFLYCKSCDFEQDVKQILPRTPFETVEELVKEAHRFHCSVCGAKNITVRELD